MHELSLTQSVVELCEQVAAGRRVTAVTIEIGAFSGVEPEAISFCFEACSRDTVVEGAELRVERVTAIASCLDCSQEFSPRAYFDPCPGCGGFRLTLHAGEELRVKSLEVD